MKTFIFIIILFALNCGSNSSRNQTCRRNCQSNNALCFLAVNQNGNISNNSLGLCSLILLSCEDSCVYSSGSRRTSSGNRSSSSSSGSRSSSGGSRSSGGGSSSSGGGHGSGGGGGHGSIDFEF